MGTGKPGQLSDYSNAGINGQKSQPEDSKGCDQAFSASLEEVERGDYYRQNSRLPETGLHVVVGVSGRVNVMTVDGEIIGYLPTKFNYLFACIEQGYSYIGQITSVSDTPYFRIQVDIAPAK